jgi:hypothetical protein
VKGGKAGAGAIKESVVKGSTGLQGVGAASQERALAIVPSWAWIVAPGRVLWTSMAWGRWGDKTAQNPRREGQGSEGSRHGRR